HGRRRRTKSGKEIERRRSCQVAVKLKIARKESNVVAARAGGWRLSKDQRLAGCRMDQSENDTQGRCLARTIWTQIAEYFATLNCKSYAAKRGNLPELLRYISEFKRNAIEHVRSLSPTQQVIADLFYLHQVPYSPISWIHSEPGTIREIRVIRG